MFSTTTKQYIERVQELIDNKVLNGERKQKKNSYY
ncbi:hypothetical protein JOC33_002670 [Thalassobacillus pellis]|nr:hypothetical protein [Thalassobacillus pellis]